MFDDDEFMQIKLKSTRLYCSYDVYFRLEQKKKIRLFALKNEMRHLQ